jgi:hypothetical protein
VVAGERVIAIVAKYSAAAGDRHDRGVAVAIVEAEAINAVDAIVRGSPPFVGRRASETTAISRR